MAGRDIRDTLGLIAVVAGLVFVGVGIRQNTATRQALADVSREWLTMLGQDAEDLWFRAWRADREEVVLSEADVRRAQALMRANLRRLENVYLQHAGGLLDASALAVPTSSPPSTQSTISRRSRARRRLSASRRP